VGAALPWPGMVELRRFSGWSANDNRSFELPHLQIVLRREQQLRLGRRYASIWLDCLSRWMRCLRRLRDRMRPARLDGLFTDMDQKRATPALRVGVLARSEVCHGGDAV
jgi:hypothetical protein